MQMSKHKSEKIKLLMNVYTTVFSILNKIIECSNGFLWVFYVDDTRQKMKLLKTIIKKETLQTPVA